MKPYLYLSAFMILLAGTAEPSAAGDLCGCLCHCTTPPCETCPDCGDPCASCLRMPTLCDSAHAVKLMEQLKSDCACCARIKAAEKLGCRLHADFCACPEILDALIHALQCDTCWEVRRAAAWAIAMQGARVLKGVAALYVASKVDRHYMVRDRATDALGILILCRNKCYADLFKAADALIPRIRPEYDPTNGKCACWMIASLCDGAGHAEVPLVPLSSPPIVEPTKDKQ